MLVSTLDEYFTVSLLPLFPIYPVAAIRWWVPGARCHLVDYYMETADG
mgnify:CR=1 FL=1